MKPKQFFFVTLGIMVLIVGCSGAGYYYAYKFMNQQSAGLSVQLAEQSVADQQLGQLDNLKIRYERDVEPILPLIDDTLPRNKKQSEVLAQVQRLAVSSGMAINAVTVPDPVGLPSNISQTIQAGKVLAMPLSFKVTGTYHQLQNFTAHLETLNRFTNITTLNIKREAAGTASYTFVVNAYIKT